MIVSNHCQGLGEVEHTLLGISHLVNLKVPVAQQALKLRPQLLRSTHAVPFDYASVRRMGRDAEAGVPSGDSSVAWSSNWYLAA